MKVWVIEIVDYDSFIEGVAASPEAARAFLKRTHSCAASWTDRPLGTIGHFKRIPGKCVEHNVDYTFTEHELQGMNPKTRICVYCSKPFAVGVGSGRRADAKFCSAKHQITFNSLKRSCPLKETAQ